MHCIKKSSATPGELQLLAWSSDSELLAVCTRISNCQAVQMWTRSNWHWYLKQELRFPDEPSLSMFWSDEGPSILTILTASGQLEKVCSPLLYF